MAVSEYLLAAIKQQAQFIKSELCLPHSQAMEAIASFNGFSNWHELGAVAKANPFDSRLLGAALNRRAAPGIRTPAAVQYALRSVDRIAADYPAVEPLRVFLKSRGFASKDEVTPAFQVDLPAYETSRMQINLFSPTPRLVTVAGMPGAGKSMMAMHLSAKHLAAGGAVCLVDLFHNGLSAPSERDLATQLKLILMDCYSEQLAVTDMDSLPDRFSEFTHIGPEANYSRQPLPPLDQYLASIRSRLLPFSLLVLDEIEYMLERCSGTDLVKLSLELKRLREDGHAVVLVTQRLAGEVWLSLAKDIKDDGIVIFGRFSRMMFDRVDSELKPLLDAGAQLAIEPGRSAQYLLSGVGYGPGVVALTPSDIFPEKMAGRVVGMVDQCVRGITSIGNHLLGAAGGRDE